MDLLWLMIQALGTIPMIPRDASFGLGYWQINRMINSWSEKGWTIHQVFDEVVKENPQKPAIRHEEIVWTYQKLHDYSLQVAHYFYEEGYREGDIIGLLMTNKPQYIGTWLGLSRIGVVTAMVNNQVKGESLNQAVTKAAQCKAIICDSELQSVLKELQASDFKLPEDMKIYTSGPRWDMPLENAVDLDPLLLRASKDPLDVEITKELNLQNKMAYIYTSGTEGMPKAAIWKFRRYVFLAVSIHNFLSIKKDDVLYTPMPLYHASGGLVGTSQMLLFGNTMIIKTKFSASQYFADCKKYGATVGQYIGEMCSYIYSRKPSPEDKDHKVRMLFGNGMRRHLWKDFKKRFNIKKIGEFYGSTEGNTNMVNINNKQGSVGFLPWYSNFIYPVDLVQYDPETGKPIRGKNGLCIRANKKGLLVGGIKKDSSSSNFEGYADKKATESKIIRDVFKKGDAYFNSGDVLERDPLGYYYFVDRLGDTFRWKGENVAASQTESIISQHMGLNPSDVAVYGVEVKNQEGKAGMAALAMNDNDLDKKLLVKVAQSHMFPAQIPVFLWITKDFPRTPTEKIKKTELKKKGWDPDVINAGKEDNPDKLYFFNPTAHEYQLLTPDIRDKIISQQQRI